MTKITIDKALIEQAIDYIRSTSDYKMGHPAACESVCDLEDALAEPAEPDYRSMYLKVRDELAEAQQRLDTCEALARSVMNDQTGRA